MIHLRHKWLTTALFIALASFGWSQEEARSQSCCRGEKEGQQRRGRMKDASHAEDRELFHFLLDNREKIRRTVAELPDGVETLTESDSTEIADKIREHVRSMYRRIEEGRPIHRRDPLFAEIFENADKIEMSIEDTDDGLRVRETSSDPYVAKLIKSHADVVTAFLENGRSEMHKNHALPERE